jgi:hypothetical protein
LEVYSVHALRRVVHHKVFSESLQPVRGHERACACMHVRGVSGVRACACVSEWPGG